MVSGAKGDFEGDLDFDWDSDWESEGSGEETSPEKPEHSEPAPETGNETAEGEMDFDWGDEFSLGESGADQEPEEKKSEPEPAAEDSEEWDWDSEFSLGETEPEPAAPASESAKSGGPAEETGEDDDLSFDSAEFGFGETGGAAESEDDGPIELAPDQILDIRERSISGAGGASQQTQAAAGSPSVCQGCGAVITEQVSACPDCGAVWGTGAGQTVAGQGLAASYWGSFASAYPTVLGAEGWKYVGMYVLLGVFAPMLLIFIPCAGGILAWAVKYGAVVGAMYSFMGHVVSNGPSKLEDAKRPSVFGDMVEPALNVGCASGLVWLVLILGVVASIFFGALSLDQLQDNLRPGDLSDISSLLGLAGGAVFVLAAGALAMILWPMTLMVFGASQSVLKAVNPVNTIKAIVAAPGPYLGILAFFWLNYVAVLGIRLGLGMFIPQSGNFFLAQIIGGPALAVGSYVGAVTGWRMGVYLFNNDRVFDHV
jgi:hypothetical protein